jgi:hypothetical protein
MVGNLMYMVNPGVGENIPDIITAFSGWKPHFTGQ